LPYYSEEELRTLHQYFGDGKTDEDIAQRLGRTVGAIAHKRSNLGYSMKRPRRPKRMFTVEENAEILRRIRAGETPTQIASNYGVGRWTIENKINALMLAENARKPKYTVATPRRCLGACGDTFVSRWPPAIERICPDCARNDAF
jgi:DNA-binding NarL/FixJ family response regulator